MNLMKVIIVSMLSFTILCGCGSDTIEIEGEYKFLTIQGVDNNGVASKETKKEVEDIDKISTFIQKIESVEVTEQKPEKIKEKNKLLNETGNYIIALAENEKLQGKTYFINMFEDGSFIYQDPSGTRLKYVSIQNHPNLYEEVKKLLMISY
ncbi:hypothetical protein [Pseudalkalibacillus hwajinpoensis]|uniref:Lipoprotein n=1 Tax=Guptibacillus hwajinpoensis TaxID=208199 RepID=A0A4U1MH87_9BACL|nr:hypothetical protein [Pseudalkalibacillus hwajinpoensis]TKD69766.1 hypothetical protein FBF83_10790 [Pseudalkalibacillus hwajinpoensis]